MKILVACEESQAVTKVFRALGHDAFSCDILEQSGGHPEWHIKGDAVKEAYSGKYDMMICFTPCTHLAVSGTRHFAEKIADGRQQQGIDLFMKFVHAPIEKIAIENPVGIMSTVYKKPTQIIQPYYFGDEFQKTTCLWLKNLPPLFHNKKTDLFNEKTTHVSKGGFDEGTRKDGRTWRMASWLNKVDSKDRGHQRSKTFPGIAEAMANQWNF